ncbi:hypothetical protein OTB20_11980 [Streptomyces sp. H27-H1]|uniref:hypothetical protein n=1 Tax=Streptomyces sp. H27-H1 TaxID=2996461 RepID=UPI00226D77A3|nr:hypothetical protein [Streptomyces sp. H27-H1]MCY0926909.1 hypothetical protein [Streptomyces sp. H27-H1]
MTTAVSEPLHDPERDSRSWTPPVDIALGAARDALARTASADIHDHNDMVRAAAGLDYALRGLVAALDAEGAR